MSYSVVIRTLGTSLDKLRKELESIALQTVQPDKVVIYIAKGYPLPDFRVAAEEYVVVEKGMMTQRALDYKEVDSEYMLMLDDDVFLEPDVAERLLADMKRLDADCIACDMYHHHQWPLLRKMADAVVKWTLPSFSKKWAFRIRPSGAFSYINFPGTGCYPSMSGPGAASIWRKSAFTSLHIEDECWIDRLRWSYGDDALIYYKLYLNGGRLFAAFGYGATHMDAATSSSAFRKSGERYLTMAKATVLAWHRMQYRDNPSRLKALFSLTALSARLIWMILVLSLLSPAGKSWRQGLTNYIKGISEARKFIRSPFYANLPSYVLPRPAEREPQNEQR